MHSLYYDHNFALRRNVFAPSLPRRAKCAQRSREDVSFSSSLPQTNFMGFATARPESTQASRPVSTNCSMGGWLRERARWKSMQKSGIETLPYPPALTSPLPSYPGFSSPQLNLVELSLTPDEAAAPKREQSPEVQSVHPRISVPQTPETHPDAGLSYVYLRPKSQKFTNFLRNRRVRESPKKHLSSTMRSDRVHRDEKSRKLYANVVVPVAKKTASAASSRLSSAYTPNSTRRSKGRDTVTPRPPDYPVTRPWVHAHALYTPVTQQSPTQSPKACESPAHSSRNPTPILESRYKPQSPSKQAEDPTPQSDADYLTSWDARVYLR